MLCLLLCFMNIGAWAETERGDLTERFSDEITVEYNGVTYRLRSRLTTVLAMGTSRTTDPEGQVRVEYLAMIVVDDDLNQITPIQLDVRTLVPAADGETVQLRMCYGQEEDAKLNCEQVLQAVNALLPDAILEHYVALDIDGLDMYDDEEALAAAAAGDTEALFKARLRTLQAEAESASSSELNALFNELSDYIVTDLKSGAMMRIADKVDRYDVLPTVDIAGEVTADAAGGEVYQIDTEDLLANVVSTFFEEKIW